MSVLVDAVLVRDYGQVEELLRAGADPNEQLTEDTVVLGVDDVGATMLLKAADAGDMEMVKLLLRYRADPNIASDNGDTPLLFAAGDGYLDIVQLLLDHGARTGIQTGVNRNFPLLWAAHDGRLEIMQLLLDHGADPNIQDDSGSTPLKLAASNGHVDAVALLLRSGAEPNIASLNGWTPLYSSVHEIRTNQDSRLSPIKRGHYMNIVHQLLEAGADPTIRTNFGLTPLDVSRLNKAPVLQKLLTDAEFTWTHTWTPEEHPRWTERERQERVQALLAWRKSSQRRPFFAPELQYNVFEHM